MRKGKNKRCLELKEEEREIGVKLGVLTFGRKRTYEKSSKVETERKEPQNIMMMPPSFSTTPITIKPSIEGKAVIKPNTYETIEIGRISRGGRLVIELKETFGETFSAYIFDEDNLKKYAKESISKGAIWSGTNCNEYQDDITLKMAATYHLVITSRAYQKKRTVWYHLDVVNG